MLRVSQRLQPFDFELTSCTSFQSLLGGFVTLPFFWSSLFATSSPLFGWLFFFSLVYSRENA
jgi:hypothetical protein